MLDNVAYENSRIELAELQSINRVLQKESGGGEGAGLKAVFNNPQEFLDVLRRDYDKIAPKNQNLITRNDLISYSITAKDPESRAAATIAAKRFEELRSLAAVPNINTHFDNNHEIEGRSVEAISRSDLQAIQKFNEGQTTYYNARNLAVGAGYTAAFGGLAAFMAPLLRDTIRMGPPYYIAGPYLGSAMLLTTVAMGGFMAVQTYRSPGKIQDLAERNQRTLANWTEINRRPS